MERLDNGITQSGGKVERLDNGITQSGGKGGNFRKGEQKIKGMRG